MTARPAPYFATCSLALLLALPGMALAQQGKPDRFGAADIEAAGFSGDLPRGRSAVTAKVQILLDRSGTSPGVIDGFKGGMSESAIQAFERRAGLPVDGVLDLTVWNLLQPYAVQPLTQDYTITQADAEGLVDAIPTDYAEKAKMSAMAYTSIAEKLGERFHMDEKFIAALNPDIELVPGATIKVAAPAKPIKGTVTRIIIDKTTRRVAGYDTNGDMLVDYPATVGSTATPSPSGNHKVVTVALDPNYTYNPKVNFKQGKNDKVLTIPPGPNGPVGNVWIDLSKPTYGIHGTPTPSRLFVNQSNGCVRLTNWDARELANLVKSGTTTVEFLEPGVTIADVTGSTPVELPETQPVTSRTVSTAEPAPATGRPAEPSSVSVTTLPPATTGTLPGAIQEDTTEPETSDNLEEDFSVNDALSKALSKALEDGAASPATDTGN